MNAGRREFDGSAQLRDDEPHPADSRRVYAFSPVTASACELRTRVNADYAVKKGVQGKASADVAFDVCLIRQQIASLRALPSGLFWNGSAPDLQLWRGALIRHDGRSRGGSAHGMLRGHRKGSALAAELGFTSGAPARAWQRYRTCAVVGGAPTLISRARLGRAIDQHDAVLRFNDHPTGGRYGPYVGNRTHFRILNSLYAAAPPPRSTEHVLQFVQSGKRVASAMVRAARDGHARRHLVEPEVYRTFFLHFGSGGLTGALGVWFALGMCERVSLYGFSSPCDLGRKYTHYHSALAHKERMQVNTVKVVLWTRALACARLVRWAPFDARAGEPESDDGAAADRTWTRCSAREAALTGRAGAARHDPSF